MRFGHFDDAAREYVIKTPRTPYPWINYLGTEEFFGLVSHTGGGYCFYRDARLRRLTRYRYNNVPTDVGGRYFYIHDGGDFWTPGWAPVQARARPLRVPARASRTRGSPGSGRASGPRCCTSCRSAPTPRSTGYASTNTLGAAKSVKLFSFVEFCLWNAWDDQTNYQRNLSIGEVEVDGSDDLPHDRVPRAAQPLRRLLGERPGRRASTPTARASSASRTASTSRRPWPRGSRATPSPAAGRRSARTSSAVDLAPGEAKSFVFVLGYVENPVAEKWEKPGVVNKTPARGSCSPASGRPSRWTRRWRRCATTGRSCSRRTR